MPQIIFTFCHFLHKYKQKWSRNKQQRNTTRGRTQGNHHVPFEVCLWIFSFEDALLTPEQLKLLTVSIHSLILHANQDTRPHLIEELTIFNAECLHQVQLMSLQRYNSGLLYRFQEVWGLIRYRLGKWFKSKQPRPKPP